MSDQQKWTYEANGPRSRRAFIRDENGFVVATEVPVDQAPRIVAAVNACTGIKTEALEKAPVGALARFVRAALSTRNHLAEVQPHLAGGSLSVTPFLLELDSILGELGVPRIVAEEPAPSPSQERS